MSDINYEFIKLRKKRRRILLTSGFSSLVLIIPLLLIFFVGNPFADSTKYSSCDYADVLSELKHANTNYELPTKSAIPLENIFAINFKSAYHTLYSHAITHPSGERAGDFIKDRCRFLVEQALTYRSSDNALLNKDMVIMLVNEGNFKDLSTQIVVKDEKYCLGVEGRGRLEDFKDAEKKIIFYKGSCGKFFKDNFYSEIEDDKIVIFPPDNKGNGSNEMVESGISGEDQPDSVNESLANVVK